MAMAKRRRDEQEDEVHRIAKKRFTVVGKSGSVWVVSSTRPLTSSPPPRLQTNSTSSDDSGDEKSSSVSKQLRTWARMKEDEQIRNLDGRVNCSDANSTIGLQHAKESSRAKLATIPSPNENTFAHYRKREKVILCQTTLFFMLMIFFISSVVYTLTMSRNLQILQQNAMHQDTIDEYNSILQEKEQAHQHLKSQLNTAKDDAKQSQLTITRIVEEMEESDRSYRMLIEDYKAVAQQHDEDKNAALTRIAALRSQKEDSSSALDLAWLRMDDLLHENNDLSLQLKRTKKKLESKIEYLTLERDKLLHRRDALEEEQKTHEDTMNMLFAPLLSHTLDLQQTSEHQHSVIVELTSVVQSLHESLENSETDLDTQIVIAHAQSKVHEMERISLMQSMEAQLQQLEEEAVGAVNAVATASGKLEFERKSEEQTRWNEYVSQVESILGDMSSETGEGIVETSVLRAAITRKVETGLNALKKYVHPHHFVNKRDDSSLIQMEIEA